MKRRHERVEKSLATSVVLQLSEKYFDACRTLCTDNFYTSIDLAEKLLERDTHLIGTIRSNRKGLPTAVTKAKLKVGEVTAAHNEKGIVVLKWKDKREVMVLSTKHDSSMTNSGKFNRKRELVRKPNAVLDYNKAKLGIDLSDQMASYH
jgi:Transposase IS4